LEVLFEDQVATLKFPAPAAFEIDEEAFDFPEANEARKVILDFDGVKIVSSLVISKVIYLVERNRNRPVVFVNIGPELRNLLRRAGFNQWLNQS
jgi:anti-anti-sigma regulatory factor